MLVIHGIYRFEPKRVAFRNDFCLSCSQPRRCVKIRTFDVLHIMWIPIVPLGFRNRWICSSCGKQPHVNRKTRRPFKWVGLFVLLLLSVAYWAIPVDPEIAAVAWALRIGAPVGAILVVMHLLRTPKGISLKERVSAVEPAMDTVCPFCGKQLLSVSSRYSCPACGVFRV